MYVFLIFYGYDFINVFLLQDGDGLLERYKNKRMENFLEFYNKILVWNDGMFDLIYCML